MADNKGHGLLSTGNGEAELWQGLCGTLTE
jgi:hypothetical protein